MPGILLYCNGMKPKFKIKLQYDKKNNIWAAIAIILAVVMYVTIDFSIVALIAYGFLYYLVKSLHLELDDRCPWLWTLILFIGGSCLTTFSIQYMLLDPENFTRTTYEKLFLNVLCCLIVYFVVQIFTNNSGLTCIIAHVSLLSFGFVDYFVYLFRGNEFTFSDIRSIGTGLSVAGNYKLQLNDRGVYVIFLAALFIAFVRKWHVRFTGKIQMRVISVMAIALSCVIIAANAYDVNTETWEQKGTYRNGYLLNYVLGVRDSFISAPEGYSKDKIKELEKTYQSDKKDYSTTNEKAKNPTIIAIMNESFSDLSVLGDLQTNMPLTPFIDSLKENTTKGYALSSVFGAKTPNSEWEFMSGNSMAFLPMGSVVYQQYISDTPTTIVSNLKDDGYTCIAMHIMKPDGAGIWCIRISGLTKCTLLIILTRQRSCGNILPTRNCMIRLSSVMKTVKIMKNCSLWELPCRTTVVIRKPMTIFRRIIIKLDVLIRMPTSICPWYTRVMRQ